MVTGKTIGRKSHAGNALWCIVGTVGILVTSGCCHNGAVEFDPKCGCFDGASLSKMYYIEEIEVEGPAGFWGDVMRNMKGTNNVEKAKAVQMGPGGALSKPTNHCARVSSNEKTDGKMVLKGYGSLGRQVADWLAIKGPLSQNFTTVRTENAEPISIRVSFSKDNANGAIAGVNNFLAGCTANIWPWYHSASFAYNVKVKSATGSKSEQFKLAQQSLTSWTPLALFPVPAWADYRDFSDFPLETGVGAEQVGKCVVSLLAEKTASAVEKKKER